MKMRTWLIIGGLGMACTGEEKTEVPETIEEPPTYCEQLGLTEQAFDESGTTGDFGQVAPDFTLNLLDGETWTLSENWTGCDNFIFVNYYSANEYPTRLTRPREIQELLSLAPVNTHFFIMTYPAQGEDIEALMGELESNFEAAYGMLDDEETTDWWREKVHFVLDDGWSADWIGVMNSDYYTPNEFVLWSSAIDRQQRIREVGNYCDPSTGWEQCPPFFMAYESIYFNFEAQREAELVAQNATVVDVFTEEVISDPGWAGQRFTVEVDLPDAATMETFDTMHLDLNLECVGYPAGTQCPAWDYIVHAYLCEVDDPSTEEDESDTCSKEFGRWITTYWRPGRWVHDATPMLAWIQDGGTRKFQFYTQQPYKVSMDLRFSNQDKGYRPLALEEVYRGGALDDFYNWGRYHSLTETEWRQWTIEETQDSFSILSTAEVNDDRSVRIMFGSIDFIGFGDSIDGQPSEVSMDVLTHNETDQYWITHIPPASEGDVETFQRVDYTWTDDPARPLAICLSEDAALSQEEADSATEHCLVDDPTNCTLRADSENLRGGCNFGAWTMLSSDNYNSEAPDVEDVWTERRHQQYWLMDNGSDNARYANKSSRWDWFVAEDTLYFCETEANVSDVETVNLLLESCAADNANTDTHDESTNCTLQVNQYDLDRGCNGRGWRQMTAAGVLDEANPTGNLTEVWHEDKLPIAFTPPAGTTKVDIAGVISGHGFGADTLNCAEFCDHQHQFWINDGTPALKTHPEAGTSMGCAEQVAIGTVPNQSGTWVYGRAGWCPGMEVPVWTADLTESVDMTGENTLEYLGLVKGEIYRPTYTSGTFRPRVDMRSYLVYYQ